MKRLGLIGLLSVLCMPNIVVAGGEPYALAFTWETPTEAVPCELYGSSGLQANELRFVGQVSQHYIGKTCEVEVPKAVFDRHFQFCAVSYVENYGVGHFACGVTHLGRYVRFVYSYGRESRAAPLCEFVCTGK